MDLAELGGTAYKALGAPVAALVMAHGAGAGQHHPFMVAVAKGLASRGVDVVTFDFPYMRQRRRAPDRAPVLEQAFLDVVGAARRWSGAPGLFIGGKSMGGRIATHLGAAGRADTAGIAVFGYPLHPPDKPDQPRVAHLPSIMAPVLIVQGERDAFGTPEELGPVVRSMRASVELHVVAGGDHSLSVRGRPREAVLDEVLDATVRWMRRQGQA
jgi:hypothetical protein